MKQCGKFSKMLKYEHCLLRVFAAAVDSTGRLSRLFASCKYLPLSKHSLGWEGFLLVSFCSQKKFE